MRVKDGVRIRGLSPEAVVALMMAEPIWRDHAQELVVTSATDGNHSTGSLHHTGEAVDLRTRYFQRGESEEVAEELRAALPDSYDVVNEGTHMHVEHDPK